MHSDAWHQKAQHAKWIPSFFSDRLLLEQKSIFPLLYLVLLVHWKIILVQSISPPLIIYPASCFAANFWFILVFRMFEMLKYFNSTFWILLQILILSKHLRKSTKGGGFNEHSQLKLIFVPEWPEWYQVGLQNVLPIIFAQWYLFIRWTYLVAWSHCSFIHKDSK